MANYSHAGPTGSRAATPACWPWIMAMIACAVGYVLRLVLSFVVGVAGLLFVIFVGGPDPRVAGVVAGYFVVITLVAVLVGTCLRALGVRRAFTAAIVGGWAGAIAGFATPGLRAVVGSSVEFVIVALIIKGAEPKAVALSRGSRKARDVR